MKVWPNSKLNLRHPQPTACPLVLSSWSAIPSIPFPADVAAFFAATDFFRQKEEFDEPFMGMAQGSVVVIKPRMNVVGGFGEPFLIVTKEKKANKIAKAPGPLQVFQKQRVPETNDYRYVGLYRVVGGVRQASAKDLRTDVPEDLAHLRRILLGHLSQTKDDPLAHSVKDWKFKIKVPKKTVKNPQHDLQALTDAAMEDLKTNDEICITYLVLAPDGPVGYDLPKFAEWWDKRSKRVRRNPTKKIGRASCRERVS